MPEPILIPFCIALGAAFAGKRLGLAAGEGTWTDLLSSWAVDLAGDSAKGTLKNLLKRAGDSALDPATGLPRNHDLQRASRDALREAVLVGVLELAGRLDPKKPWLPAILDHIKDGNLFQVPLIEARHDPQREWLEAFRELVAGDKFKAWHDGLLLGEEDARKCFQGGQCHLAPVLTPRLLAWARKEVQVGQEPPGFAALVTDGWEIPGGSGRITLEQAYCLFFREHFKQRPEVFRIYVADTLAEVLKRQMDAATKSDLAAFEQWLDPQLGELKALLAGVADQLQAVASGQQALSDQQGQMLVALVAIQTEVRRRNADAVSEMRQFRSWLDQRLTAIAGGVSRTERNTELILDRLEPGKPLRPPFDRLPIIRAGQLVGRDALLRELVARLRRQEDVCVTGGPGFGKTALAVTALREVIGETDDNLARSPFPGGLVFLELYQLKADPDRVWIRLADAFAPGLNPTLLPRERAARACANARALVVVEGAEEAGDGAALQDLLSVLGSQIRRLILTRNAAQDFTGHPLRVDRELSRNDARQLLRRLSPERGSESQLEEIQGLLGGHPLALTHAGLQLANPEDSPAQFLRELKDSPLDKVCEPGNEKHPLRWLYDRSWRLVSDDARRVWAGCGNLAYGPFAEGAAEASLEGTETASSEHARGALRQLVRHGILSPPDDEERWLFSHALAYRYAELRADPALRLPLARWVVADFRRCLERFKRSQDPRLVVDLLSHASGLLATEPDGSWEVALELEELVYAMPYPSQTVLLRQHLTVATAELHLAVTKAIDAGREDLKPRQARIVCILGIWLGALGLHVEALAAIQAAVNLHRELAQNAPEAFTSDLAASLGNLARQLSASHLHSEAQAAAQESAELYRDLAQKDPETFTPQLAMSLGNRALALGILGRTEDALGVIAEAIEMWRVLVPTKPTTFARELAGSLNTLAILLCDHERQIDALAPGREAVDLYRALAAHYPDAFIPDFAASLGMMGGVLKANRQPETALACYREGVEQLTPSFQRLPMSFAPVIQRLGADYLSVLATTGREPDFAGSEAFLVPVMEGLHALAAQRPPETSAGE